MPDWAPLVYLAAAVPLTGLLAAATIAAAAEQEQQDDDPVHIATTEAAITKVTHNHTSEIFDAVLTAHSMVFRNRLFVRPSSFFFFCGLGPEVEGDHRGKHRQKILARQATLQRQYAKHPGHSQSHQTFDAQQFIQSAFHFLTSPTAQYAPGHRSCD